MTDALIAKLEAATEGSRRLDAEISVRLRIFPKDAPSWLAQWRGELDIIQSGRCAGCVAVLHDNGERGANWRPEPFSTSIDAALTLVPESATNRRLYDFHGHGCSHIDWQAPAWGFQFHDTAQLKGRQRAEEELCVDRVRLGSGWDRAIAVAATQFRQFQGTHAATPAIAICIAVLRARTTP